MGKRLTNEEFIQRVSEATDDKYVPLTAYINKTAKMKFLCTEHNLEFEATAECFMRGKNDVRGICPECYKEKIDARLENVRELVQCDYCGKEYTLAQSKANRSITGLHFCCREHKDLAQRASSGDKFDIMRPNHYNEISLNYRKTAFDAYPHICATCGWDEDERILEVHHIDSNRSNCKLNNLVILCPTCHRKITLGYYDFDPITKKLSMLT